MIPWYLIEYCCVGTGELVIQIQIKIQSKVSLSPWLLLGFGIYDSFLCSWLDLGLMHA